MKLGVPVVSLVPEPKLNPELPHCIFQKFSVPPGDQDMSALFAVILLERICDIEGDGHEGQNPVAPPVVPR